MLSSLGAIRPCLPSFGNAGQMSNRCFKVHHNRPLYDTRSSLIRACTCLCAEASNYKRPSATFYRCRGGRFSSVAALCKLSVETQGPSTKVTFSNIRSPSKCNYAAAYFNSEQQPATLTESSTPYLQPRQYTEKALKPISLTLPSLHNIFHPLQKNTRWRARLLPTHSISFS